MYIDDNVPRSHNINFIVYKFSDKLSTPVSEEHQRLFDRLTAYYINGHYPEYKEKLSSSINEKTAKQIFEETKEVFKWLLMQKP